MLLTVDSSSFVFFFSFSRSSVSNSSAFISYALPLTRPRTSVAGRRHNIGLLEVVGDRHVGEVQGRGARVVDLEILGIRVVTVARVHHDKSEHHSCRPKDLVEERGSWLY